MNPALSSSRRRLTSIRHFLLRDLWEADTPSLSRLHRVAASFLRVAWIVVRGVQEDECYLRAAALTFITLVALVPMLMIAFVLVKGLGFGPLAAQKIMDLAAEMPEQFRAFLQQILDIVQHAHLAALGWIGMVFLTGAGITVLSSLDAAINRIWGIFTMRNPFRRAILFAFVLVVVPILTAAALALTVVLSSATLIARLGPAAGAYRVLLHLAPVFILWLAFVFLYLLVPNTRVRPAAAISGGLAATLLWLGWQRLYIWLQVNVAQYNGIYGTFASVPIFLGWLYVGWVIVLLGAELAFAIQNSATYQRERLAPTASARTRLTLTLEVALEAAEALAGRGAPFDAPAFAQRHLVPIRLLNEQVRRMVQAGLLTEIASRQGIYVLTRAPEALRLRDLANVALSSGAPPEALGLRQPRPAVERALRGIESGIEQSLHHLTLRDLLDGAPRAERR